MQPTADLSILTLVANASLVVKCVLAILVFLSLASWTVIFQKYFTISRAARQVEEFEARFWSGTELNQLLETAKRNHDTAGIEERIFSAGMTEYLKQSRQDPNALNSVSRAMRAVYNREMDHLERSLPLLASICSRSITEIVSGTLLRFTCTLFAEITTPCKLIRLSIAAGSLAKTSELHKSPEASKITFFISHFYVLNFYCYLIVLHFSKFVSPYG